MLSGKPGVCLPKRYFCQTQNNRCGLIPEISQSETHTFPGQYLAHANSSETLGWVTCLPSNDWSLNCSSDWDAVEMQLHKESHAYSPSTQKRSSGFKSFRETLLGFDRNLHTGGCRYLEPYTKSCQTEWQWTCVSLILAFSMSDRKLEPVAASCFQSVFREMSHVPGFTHIWVFSPAPNPALCVLTCLAVHQDVQHRLARHQLQIRGLLWRFPHVAKVRKILHSLTFESVLGRTQSQVSMMYQRDLLCSDEDGSNLQLQLQPRCSKLISRL